MKKIITVLLALSLGVISFSGCTKKDPPKEPDNPIVGEWEYEGGGYVYIFRPDGTGTYNYLEYSQDFTYETEGNVLTLSFEDSDPRSLEFKLDGDTLTLTNNSGDVVYNRKTTD